MLGLEVCGEWNTLWWMQGSTIQNVPDVITQQNLFSLFWKLVEHLSVCGWLHVVTGFIKQWTNMVTKGWDDQVDDILLKQMVKETVDEAQQEDPAWSDWCVNRSEISGWVNAKSLTTGVVVEKMEQSWGMHAGFSQQMMPNISTWVN